MIIGNGQIASRFRDVRLEPNLLIFASGVSNSNCTNRKHFTRERQLVKKAIDKYPNRKFVYFSSCSLSQDRNLDNDYYAHKREIENIIQDFSQRHIILRIPQIFSYPKVHSTLIHFLYFSILRQEEFKLNDGATRYLLDVADIPDVVNDLAVSHNGIVDVANPHQYSIRDIVSALEAITKMKAIYSTYSKIDRYDVDFCGLDMLSARVRKKLSGQSYFYERMSTYHTLFKGAGL